nr:hypothetical protein [Streptomyces sp. FXJ1.172]WEP00880.1 hypothetical protein A6P39_042715 [Streptomyces sp. FXJ1.172]
MTRTRTAHSPLVDILPLRPRAGPRPPASGTVPLGRGEHRAGLEDRRVTEHMMSVAERNLVGRKQPKRVIRNDLCRTFGGPGGRHRRGTSPVAAARSHWSADGFEALPPIPRHQPRSLAGEGP